MTRESRQAWRSRNAATERGIDAAVAEVKADAASVHAQAKARIAGLRKEWAAMPTVPREQITAGMRVADRRGRIGDVVKVNAKTVDVVSYGFHARWSLESIIVAKVVA